MSMSSAGTGVRVSLRIPRGMIFILTTLLAAVGALAFFALHSAGGNSGPVRLAAAQSKLWATTIPGQVLAHENFPASVVDEFVVDITNPNGVTVKVGVVRYPAYRGDVGVPCNNELRPRTSARCRFTLPVAAGLEAVAVLIAAPLPIAVTATAIWKFRRDPKPPATAFVNEDVVMPVQVHEVS